MCESTAYTSDGKQIMEDVISVKVEGEKILLADILNRTKEFNGRIVEIDLDKHGIFIETVN
ncbi:MAG TPA: CooT family nickel-binding protein [Methanobacterium sp.]|nr:CooT family nickel-binding protein [Methanobacterium sp.]